MQLTLLDMTQDILNDLDGEYVNSIDGTEESQQVAQIIKTCYMEMMSHRNWPHLGTAFHCQSNADTNNPTLLTLPSNIKELQWIKYNKRKTADTRDKYEKLIWKEPEDFYEYCSARASSASNVQVCTGLGVRLNIRTNLAPTFWTSFNDGTIVCDSFDNTMDTTLQQGKNDCWGYKSPTWTHTSTAVPDLPEEAFPALLEEAKSTAFYVLKQVMNQKAESKAQRQNSWLARKAWRTKGGVRYPDYGRRRAMGTYARKPPLDKN